MSEKTIELGVVARITPTGGPKAALEYGQTAFTFRKLTETEIKDYLAL